MEQAGIIQLHQLALAGVGRRQRERLLHEQVLVRLAPGVYRLSVPADPWLQELYATLACAGPEAVVWRRSAARWWGLDGLDDATAVEVAVGPSGRRGDRRVSRVGRELQAVREGGVAVTTVSQTLLDIGPVVGPDRVERALEDGLRRGVVDLAGLQRLMGTAPRASAVLRSVPGQARDGRPGDRERRGDALCPAGTPSRPARARPPAAAGRARPAGPP